MSLGPNFHFSMINLTHKRVAFVEWIVVDGSVYHKVISGEYCWEGQLERDDVVGDGISL